MLAHIPLGNQQSMKRNRLVAPGVLEFPQWRVQVGQDFGIFPRREQVEFVLPIGWDYSIGNTLQAL
jgi:hypothetical protein